MAASERIKLIIDSREQKPWDLNPAVFDLSRSALPTGDYALGEHSDSAVIERKSLGDFVSTVIADWPRFRRELYRLAAFDHPLIVVEASIEDIVNKRYESDAEPNSVLGRMNSIMIDHGIPVVCWHNRKHATYMAERYLMQLHRKLKC